MKYTIERLIKAIQHAPSADNSQPWRIDWHENTLSIYYDLNRVKNQTFPPDHPATLLAIGSCLENLKQAADAANMNYNFTIPLVFDSNTLLYFKFSIKNLNTLSPNQIIPLFLRHTNRFPYLKKSLPSELIALLKNTTIGQSRAIIFEDASSINKISKLVYEASTIRFRTREINEWLGKSLRFGNSSNNDSDGLDINTLDLPPGGSIFLRLISNWRVMKVLNLFGIYKAMSYIDSLPVNKATVIIAIISPSSFQQNLNAGQLMNKIWIELNANGLAVHPYYVVSDQIHRHQKNNIPIGLEEKANNIVKEAKELFRLNESENLQMLFRVGYPKKEVTKSKRIPITKICSGLNSLR